MTKKVVTNDVEVTGSKKFFFAIFGTFGRYVTNVKKSKINPPTVHCTVYSTVKLQ
jgi:hypothetical protein